MYIHNYTYMYIGHSTQYNLVRALLGVYLPNNMADS